MNFSGSSITFLQVKLSTEKDFQKEAPELKDFQIIQADLILGLFRMDLLDRLAYILDILRPNSQTLVVNILRILVRMSRHSLGAAAKIIQHKTLLPIIVSHFLPLVSPLSCSSDVMVQKFHVRNLGQVCRRQKDPLLHRNRAKVDPSCYHLIASLFVILRLLCAIGLDLKTSR